MIVGGYSVLKLKGWDFKFSLFYILEMSVKVVIFLSYQLYWKEKKGIRNITPISFILVVYLRDFQLYLFSSCFNHGLTQT